MRRRLITQVLTVLGVWQLIEELAASTRAAINAHDEMFDLCTERLTNLEAQLSEFVLGREKAK